MAYRAMDIVNKESDKTYHADFQLLGSWCEEFEKLNPGSVAKMVTGDDNQFESVTLVSAVMARRLVHAGMQLSEADCAFTKHRLYKAQLMSLVGRDGNGKIIPLAIKLCPSENADQYKAFFKDVKEVPIPGHEANATMASFLNTINHVHISDRDKGLNMAAEAEFPYSHHMYCFRHVLENCRKCKTVEMRSVQEHAQLWKLQGSTSAGEFSRVRTCSQT
jgi:hypothetical protein